MIMKHTAHVHLTQAHGSNGIAVINTDPNIVAFVDVAVDKRHRSTLSLAAVYV